MDYEVSDLVEYSHHIPLVAGWIHSEFWAEKDVFTPADLAELLRMATRPDEIPLSLVALVSGQPVGTVNLIENDDEARPHLRPWLAALFVIPEHRSCGIGSALVRALQQQAKDMGIDVMYLGTDNPGFYERFGASVHEQLSDNFCIMRLSSSTISSSTN